MQGLQTFVIDHPHYSLQVFIQQAWLIHSCQLIFCSLISSLLSQLSFDYTTKPHTAGLSLHLIGWEFIEKMNVSLNVCDCFNLIILTEASTKCHSLSLCSFPVFLRHTKDIKWPFIAITHAYSNQRWWKALKYMSFWKRHEWMLSHRYGKFLLNMLTMVVVCY